MAGLVLGRVAEKIETFVNFSSTWTKEILEFSSHGKITRWLGFGRNPISLGSGVIPPNSFLEPKTNFCRAAAKNDIGVDSIRLHPHLKCQRFEGLDVNGRKPIPLERHSKQFQTHPSSYRAMGQGDGVRDRERSDCKCKRVCKCNTNIIRVEYHKYDIA